MYLGYNSGDFATLASGSSLVCVPIITILVHRRCIQVEDAVGLVVALIGIILITKPTFLFDQTEEKDHTHYFWFVVLCVDLIR